MTALDLDRVPLSAWLLVGTVYACAGARAPSPPGPLADYRQAIEAAEVALAVSHALCASLPAEGERGRCLDGLAALEEARTTGSQILEAAEACQRAQDAECVRRASETARERLPELLRLLGRPSTNAGGSLQRRDAVHSRSLSRY